MKTLTLLFSIGLLFIIYPEANAQQVISSAGVSGTNTSGSISSTVGELVIDTKTAGGITITQGFHQTKLTITDVEELKDLGFVISISPNPTQDVLKIKITNPPADKLKYFLYDINGKAIKEGDITSGEAEISFNSFNSGTYLLKTLKNNKVIKISKIVKQ
jgi:hypothetical protein